MANRKTLEDEKPSTSAKGRLQSDGAKSKEGEPVLNARGMPIRIRKRNPIFYDENTIVYDSNFRNSTSSGDVQKPKVNITTKQSSPEPASSTKKRKVSNVTRSKKKCDLNVAKSITPTDELKSKLPTSTVTKSIVKQQELIEIKDDKEEEKSKKIICERICNMLNLPQIQNLIYHEWFYSFIDEQLYFNYGLKSCLEYSFPTITTYSFARPEWRIMRRFIGKPRRFSASFLVQERYDLDFKREKIRHIQVQKLSVLKKMDFPLGLPDKIPIALPIGTRVTARLYQPHKGIYIGTIHDHNAIAQNYRVRFDLPELGTQTIPDVDIRSDNFDEKLSLKSLTKNRLQLEDAATNEVVINTTNYPLEVQVSIAIFQLRRAFQIKIQKLRAFHDINEEAQDIHVLKNKNYVPPKLRNYDSESSDEDNSTPPELSEHLGNRFSSNIVSMNTLNTEILNNVQSLKKFANIILQEFPVQEMFQYDKILERCKAKAKEIMQQNPENDHAIPERTFKLMEAVTTILLLSSHLNNNDITPHVIRALETTIAYAKSCIEEENYDVFDRNIQLQFDYVQIGVSQDLSQAERQEYYTQYKYLRYANKYNSK